MAFKLLTSSDQINMLQGQVAQLTSLNVELEEALIELATITATIETAQAVPLKGPIVEEVELKEVAVKKTTKAAKAKEA